MSPSTRTRSFSVQGLDHVVMTCRSVDETIAFYQKLGFGAQSFGPKGDLRRALAFGSQKINLHQHKQEFEPSVSPAALRLRHSFTFVLNSELPLASPSEAALPTPGSQDLCFVVEGGIEPVITRLKHLSIPIIEGPVARAGARGELTSVYVRDPDENLIEFGTYARE